MTLLKKTSLIFGGVCICVIVIVFFAARGILLKDFAEIEQTAARQNIERATNALYTNIVSLESTTADWASWDDTYAFIEDANSKYVKTNLVDGTFAELELNLMTFVNSSGQIVHSKAFDLEQEHETPLPQGFKEHLSPDGLLLKHSDMQSGTAGILLLPECPMLVATRPILSSKDEGPIRGTVIMGRYLGDALVQELADKTRLSLTMYRLEDTEMPPDFQTARSFFSGDMPVVTRPLNDQSIAAYVLLQDIYGEPSLILRTDMPRDIYRQGQETIAYLILALVAIGAVHAGVFLFFIQKYVLSRIARLSKTVSAIGTAGDFSARISMTGKDELSILSQTINGMLSALQGFYNREAGLRQELETEMGRRVEYTRALVHELKTPLTPLLTSSDILASELKQEPLSSLARNINKGALRLESRINQLYDAAKGETGALRLNFTQVETLSLLKDIADEIASEISKRKQSLVLDLPPSLPPVQADEDRLRQIVVNLLDNAHKFTPEGGKITIRAKSSDASLIVAVEDTGPGIPEEEQQRLFQHYYRGEGKTQPLSGLGVGLALCKTLVELHAGQIWVQSRVGEGATFIFSLPLEDTSRIKKQTETGSAT